MENNNHYWIMDLFDEVNRHLIQPTGEPAHGINAPMILTCIGKVLWTHMNPLLKLRYISITMILFILNGKIIEGLMYSMLGIRTPFLYVFVIPFIFIPTFTYYIMKKYTQIIINAQYEAYIDSMEYRTMFQLILRILSQLHHNDIVLPINHMIQLQNTYINGMHRAIDNQEIDIDGMNGISGMNGANLMNGIENDNNSDIGDDDDDDDELSNLGDDIEDEPANLFGEIIIDGNNNEGIPHKRQRNDN